jgi:hypothetical protein
MLELDRYDQITSLGKPEVPSQRRPLGYEGFPRKVVGILPPELAAMP